MHLHRTRRLAFGLLLGLFAGCAGPALDLNDVLIDDGAPQDRTTSALTPLAAFDAEATAARERADRPDATPQDRISASRTLFLAADARVQIAALQVLAAQPELTLDEVVALDDRASDRVRAEVESLTRAGSDYAEQALRELPDYGEALLYRALNTSLLAWSVGKRRALFEGLGGACEDTTEAALVAGEQYGSGAALRLRGRFLSKAPWPVGDREAGLQLLQRATSIAPVRLNLLFLGDALYAEGDLSGARDAWRRVEDAESDEDSRALTGYHLRLARERLAASER